MRKLTFPLGINRTSKFADTFIAEGHKRTSKKKNHLLMFTFNRGTVDLEKMKDVDYMTDLLTQAFIICNDVDKIIIDIDVKQKDNLLINVW